MADDPGRSLVPTPREAALGIRHEVSEDQLFQRERPERRKLRELLLQFARDADPRSIEGPRRALVILALASFFTGWDRVATPVLLPDMRKEFGFSLAFLGTLGQVVIVFDTLLSPAFGFLADRVSRVGLVRVGKILGAASALWAGTAQSVPPLVGARAAAGVSNAVTDPATFPLVTDYFPLYSRPRAFSFLFAATILGGIVGPLVAGPLADGFGWRAALLALGVVGVVVAVLTFKLREPKRGMVDRLFMGASAEEASREQKAASWAEAWRSARSITTLRRLWYAMPFLYAGSAGLGLILATYYKEVFGLGSSVRGVLASAGAAFGLLGLAVSGPVAERLLRYRPGRIVGLFGGLVGIQAMAALLLAVAPFVWLAIPIAMPINFVSFLTLPALITLISLVVPARIRGLGIQTIQPWTLIGVVFLGLILFAADSLGVRPAVAMLAGLLAVGGVVVASGSVGVERDLRAALAAAMAEQEAARARAAGRAKMLICRAVDVHYDGVQVLFGVDLDVVQGEILALLGTNGAGKSTLLRAVAGTQQASGGAIFLDGVDVTHVPPHENAAGGVVVVPGGQGVFPTLTVDENLRSAAWMYREDTDYVRTKTEEVFEFFPILRERRDQAAGNLSGGEQQMLALGQAFLMRPRLLMIDELSLGLAPAIVEQLLQTLRAIHAQGTTIVVVEQSLNVALTIAQRAVYMEKGEIRFDGPTEELLHDASLVRSVFMGGAVTGAGVSEARRTRPSAAEREILLEVRNLAVSFGGVHALSDVSLEVEGEEILGIIGPNGAGKTTLFDVISGFVQPEGGSVHLAAHDVTRAAAHTRAQLGLGRSFQNVRLFPSLTVRENIAVALEVHLKARSAVLAAVWAPSVRSSERRAFRRVDRLVQLLGLEAYADKFVNELSTGTRRAVDIACVMAAEPRVLLLDEPSSGLAQAETEEIGPLLERVVRETGCAAVVIEHDLPLVTQISDRMVAMELGGVIAHGGPREVVNDQRVVASYLAASDEVLTRSGDVVRGFVNETLERVAKGQGKERTVNGGTRTKQQQRIKT